MEKCVMCQIPLVKKLELKQIFSLSPVYFDCLCPTCRQKLANFQIEACSCDSCGRPLVENGEDLYTRAFASELSGQSQRKIWYCYDCLRWLEQYSPALLKHRPIYLYNNFIKECLYRYKYQGDCRIAEIFSFQLNQIYLSHRKYQWMVLPSSPENLKKRGFHPTGWLLECAGIPYVMPLVYCGDGKRQAEKSREERLLLKDTFRYREAFDIESLQRNSFASRGWIIFDDVYTTGATLLNAKYTLLMAYKERGLLPPVMRSISLCENNRMKT